MTNANASLLQNRSRPLHYALRLKGGLLKRASTFHGSKGETFIKGAHPFGWRLWTLKSVIAPY